ncbi:DUF3565 domain-containing protein [Lyngbya confervoides]|uniref:DUF3565 domain-containing protein n=1 Tax=Lyngbya confervoides BDU141951 TaxID=1574623 RepID=A0ABD4T306_9CYAN|nr:DUF3565 domain-containing protein [Lyngbya confervoides]MCM1983034.1 DUF3565 domain-containing protein [Lyngbya confervoides BDU141951]
MLRPITGFHLDEESHWVADLDCGHSQHMRHDPPFFSRPWVLSEPERRKMQGTAINCVRCDRREFPEGFRAYRQTPVYDAHTMPPGLRNKHSTKRGVWAKIHVLQGQLRYEMADPFHQDHILTPETPGIIVAEVEHAVQPLADATFFVEFWKRIDSGPSNS